jgi:hypothetical protein
MLQFFFKRLDILAPVMPSIAADNNELVSNLNWNNACEILEIHPPAHPEIHFTFHLSTSQGECHAADIIAAQRAMTFSIAIHVSMGHCWFLIREQMRPVNACSEKCYTSKLILRISWNNREASASGLRVLYPCSARGLSALRECSVNALWKVCDCFLVLCEVTASALWVLGECSAKGDVASRLMKSI